MKSSTSFIQPLFLAGLFLLSSCGESDPDIIEAISNINDKHGDVVQALSFNDHKKTLYITVWQVEKQGTFESEHYAHSIASTAWAELKGKKDANIIAVTVEQEDLGGSGLSSTTSAALSQTFTFNVDSLKYHEPE